MEEEGRGKEKGKTNVVKSKGGGWRLERRKMCWESVGLKWEGVRVMKKTTEDNNF